MSLAIAALLLVVSSHGVVADEARDERIRRLKVERMRRDVDEARALALQTGIEGGALVAGGLALPAALWGGAAGTIAVGQRMNVPRDALSATTALTLAACFSTCTALPAGLLTGITRLGEAGEIAEEAERREARLEALERKGRPRRASRGY